MQEVQRESAGAYGDLFEGSLEAESLLLREGDDGNSAFNLGEGSVANELPVAGSGTGEGTLEVAHHLERLRCFGARAEQRIDELRERIPRRACGRLAVLLQQKAMDMRQFVSLLGCERAVGGFGFGRVVGVGEELGGH